MYNQTAVIGKYTIETLTDGMYATPLDLYREYIQNAVDSIDEARRDLRVKNDYSISIIVDNERNQITINDDGTGIKQVDAVSKLVDIGNSRKCRETARGFRGIGRLAGLGYCDKLVFTTSYIEEEVKTVVVFDAKKMRSLLLNGDDEASANAVLSQVVSTYVLPENRSRHYFDVVLEGVVNAVELLDVEKVEDYIVQNAPLGFSKEFTWAGVIEEKMKCLGYTIPTYMIKLNGKQLYKRYRDSFVSDRARRNTDKITDVDVVPFTKDDKLIALLWVAKSNYYGTIIDGAIKGIRIRQGNIMIGDNQSCRRFFKEERFNGWLFGELHVIDTRLIANARRDDFEKNPMYYYLAESIAQWTMVQTKEIRKISYERSLPKNQREIIEIDDEHAFDLIRKDEISPVKFAGESDFIDLSETDDVARIDYIDRINSLINQKNINTKYTALNVNRKLTQEERKVLERVFDLIIQKYGKRKSDSIINYILEKY